MTIEQLPEETPRRVSMLEHISDYLLDRLVRMQNEGTWEDEIQLSGLYQEIYAESLIGKLRTEPHLHRFGGKSLDFVMIETYEPYMYNIALRIGELPDEVQPVHPETMPIPVLPARTPPPTRPYL